MCDRPTAKRTSPPNPDVTPGHPGECQTSNPSSTTTERRSPRSRPAPAASGPDRADTNQRPTTPRSTPTSLDCPSGSSEHQFGPSHPWSHPRTTPTSVMAQPVLTQPVAPSQPWLGPPAARVAQPSPRKPQNPALTQTDHRAPSPHPPPHPPPNRPTVGRTPGSTTPSPHRGRTTEPPSARRAPPNRRLPAPRSQRGDPPGTAPTRHSTRPVVPDATNR